MRMLRALSASVVIASVLWGGAAMGQAASDPCAAHEKAKANAPKKVEGRVMKVDPAAGKVTIQEADGKVHEFQASPEALQKMQAGDAIVANLRPAC
jgi:Cu/Ag efflux protein CusF